MTDERLPKYALTFGSGRTLLAETYARLRRVFTRHDIYVVTVPEHRRLIRRLLPGLPAGRILAEPARRNTAPALTYATLTLKKTRGGQTVVSFFPADHAIRGLSAFARTIRRAQDFAARTGVVVTLGVKPSYPATGYGYIACGPRLAKGGGFLKRVRRFTEKPTLARARRFAGSGKHLWNAGIFTWRIDAFEAAMRRHAPGFYGPFAKLFAKNGPSFSKIKSLFTRIKPGPIDRVLMEKMGGRDLAVIRADFGWDDIGAWDALRRLGTDSGGSTLRTGGGVFEDVRGSVVVRRGRRPLIVAGVKDLIIVEHAGALLVCGAHLCQKIPILKKKLSTGRP